MADDIVRFKDFSLSPEPVVMRIAPDDFECVPEIPLDSLLDLSSLSSETDRVTQFGRIKDLFDGIMLPDSAAQFRHRMRKSTKEDPNRDPIGMRHVKPMLEWAMEVYGLRPTQPSSSSEDGSADTDISSTDGVSATE